MYYLLTAHPKHSRNVGSAIAQPTGERLSVGPLRDWRDPEGSVRSFYKPFDSVGTSAYPGAYSSFRAHIHKAEIVAKRPFTRIVLSASMPEDVAILGIRADGFDSEGRPQ